MTTFTKFLFSGVCYCLVIAGCKKNKDDDGLPPLTFEGKNTIGCKIDGKVWIPKGVIDPSGILYPTSGGYYIDPFFFPGIHIWLTTNSPDGRIELFIRNNTNSYLSS